MTRDCYVYAISLWLLAASGFALWFWLATGGFGG